MYTEPFYPQSVGEQSVEMDGEIKFEFGNF